MLFDLFKACDKTKNSHKSDFFLLRHSCAVCSELPSNIITMLQSDYMIMEFRTNRCYCTRGTYIRW